MVPKVWVVTSDAINTDVQIPLCYVDVKSFGSIHTQGWCNSVINDLILCLETLRTDFPRLVVSFTSSDPFIHASIC